ncbi:cold-inducible protein YdjO-related protein [Paenibacillus cremeus]|uniref:cold-inducible protein YdjO-related protein n=1 Tax=Paenibacillus cremeus TaxID=2163881 RepID=UPI0028F6F295|nr:cold-inducible protein YdjO-related protein [Paenibacillus cremeus]
MKGQFNKPPVQEQETSVWICIKEECKGWVREDFSFNKVPNCALCDSEMVRGTKVLPILSIEKMESNPDTTMRKHRRSIV